MTTIVGHLDPGEACVNLGEAAYGRFAINKTSSTYSVYSDAQTLHGLGRTAQRIAFLHTSYPTYGYVDASCLEDAYKFNFSTRKDIAYYGSNGPVYIPTYVVKANKKLSTYVAAFSSEPMYSVPEGTLLAVNTMDVYDSSTKRKCQVYAIKRPSDSDWITKWGGVDEAWTVDTGINLGSSPSTWGIKLNR
ncbi:hypothetical protein [Alicyclobacillus herbarius]|uniref:hypothetical protein n=1 Tax=Alicyclobacillus herbarius TaxID=122960 RepID=UPI0003FBB9B7|nr:hypothetical protein [Alicyclobacillus herbarius]